MSQKLKFILLIAAYILAVNHIQGKNSKPEGADRRKADYIFMEAQRQSAIGNTDAYNDLLRRAYDLNPADHTTGFYVGYFDLTTAGNDSIRFKNGYELMQRHFNAEPSDYYNAFMYGTVNDRMGNLDESVRVWTLLDSIYPSKLEPAFKLADALSARRDSISLKKAIGIYDRIEQTKGKSIPITSRKMRTYMATLDTASVISEVKKLIATSPENTEYNVFAGDIFAVFSQGDSALAYYNRACEIDSTSGLAYYQRAMYFKNINDSLAYDREVFNALSRESLSLDAKMELMSDYIRTLYDDPAQQPRIQSLFSTMLEQNPHEVSLRDLYCSYLLAVQDYAGAAEQLGYAVDIDPSTESRWRTLASLYIETGNYEKSIEQAQRGLHYFPSSPMLMLIIGSNHTMLKEYDKALGVYKKALSEIPENDLESHSQILGSIGDVYANTQILDSAYAYYDKALLFNPNNNLIKNNYAYLLAEQDKNLDKAERMCADALKERPDEPTWLDTYAWIMFKKKNYVEAKAYIEKALADEEEESAELYHHAGDILFWNSDIDKALEYWEKALKLEPDNKMLKQKVKNKTYFFK